MQEMIVILLGLGAAVYLGRKLYRTVTGKQSCGCSGNSSNSCSGCSQSQSCPGCCHGPHKINEKQ